MSKSATCTSAPVHCTTNENLLEDTLMGSLVPPFYKFYKPISDLSARRPAALAFC